MLPSISGWVIYRKMTDFARDGKKLYYEGYYYLLLLCTGKEVLSFLGDILRHQESPYKHLTEMCGKLY